MRAILEGEFGKEKLETTGINLQKAAVDKMRKKALRAEVADALTDRKFNVPCTYT